MFYNYTVDVLAFTNSNVAVALGCVFQALINHIGLALNSDKPLPEHSLLCLTMSNEVLPLYQHVGANTKWLKLCRCYVQIKCNFFSNKIDVS